MNKHKTQLILAQPEWQTGHNRHIRYPPLEYSTVDVITVPNRDELILGASWTIFYNTPHYAIRSLWFEDNLLPYQLDTKHFKVRHGVFLWPRFNMHTKTSLQNPCDIYVYDEYDSTCIGKIQFLNDRLRLQEIV